MAYTTLPVVTTGDFWTLTQMRTYLRDNWTASVPDMSTALGSLFVGTAANAASELLIGSDYENLVADSGEAMGMKWGKTFATTALKLSVDRVMAAQTEDVSWDVEISDEEGLHAPGGNPSVLFVANGVYLIICHLSLYNDNAFPTFRGYLHTDGADFAEGFWEHVDSGKGYVNLFAIWPFEAADILKVRVTGTAASTLKILESVTRLYVIRLGDYS